MNLTQKPKFFMQSLPKKSKNLTNIKLTSLTIKIVMNLNLMSVKSMLTLISTCISLWNKTKSISELKLSLIGRYSLRKPFRVLKRKSSYKKVKKNSEVWFKVYQILIWCNKTKKYSIKIYKKVVPKSKNINFCKSLILCKKRQKKKEKVSQLSWSQFPIRNKA